MEPQANPTIAKVLRQLKQLSTQFAEVKASLADKTQKRHEAEIRLQQYETNNRQTSSSDQPAAPSNLATVQPVYVNQTVKSRQPKMLNPDKFDGSKDSKAEVFMNQLGLYMQLNNNLLANDQAKFAFALLYTTGKPAFGAKV